MCTSSEMSRSKGGGADTPEVPPMMEKFGVNITASDKSIYKTRKAAGPRHQEKDTGKSTPILRPQRYF